MFDFRVILTVPFFFIAVIVGLITFRTFIVISLLILSALELFRRWSLNGRIRANVRLHKGRKSSEKERISSTNGFFMNMFLNKSFQEKSKNNKRSALSPWMFGPSSPPVTNVGRVRNRNFVSRNHSFAGRRSDFNVSRTTDSNLRSIPFLPTVRRALGLDNATRSPLTKTPEVAAAYPERPMAGYLPAVRLGRRERPSFSPASRAVGRSPNTVKIAPPDSRQIQNSRLFQVKNSQKDEKTKTTPNTQAVLCALKEKSFSRKRSIAGMDVTISDVQGQMAKRRRQESQQSNASTSSLPSLPDNLPDLSSKGYSIPRLKTPNLKRSINMTNLTDMDGLDWEEADREHSQKRPRREAPYNSIASSLSSSRRMKERQAVNKRKMESKENSFTEEGSGRSSPVTKKPSLHSMDTVLLKEDKDTPTSAVPKTDKATKSQQSDMETSVAEFLNKSGTHKAVRTPKRVALTEKVSARRREMSMYAGLNKSYKNVPQANVVAKIEDYDKDREEEEKRVQDMMSEIGEPEKKAVTPEMNNSSTVSTTSSASISATAVSLGSTTPLSVTSSSASLNSTPASTSTPGISSVSTTASTNSASPASKPLASAGFSFGGSPSGAGGVNGSSSTMASLSSSTTTVTSAHGAIASAAPFNLGTSSTSTTNTSTVKGFQFGQTLPNKADTSPLSGTLSSPSSTPASSAVLGIISNASTPTSTSAAPPLSDGKTTAVVTLSSGSGGFNFGVQTTSSSSSVTSVLSGIGSPGGFNFGAQSSSVPSTSSNVAATTSSNIGGFNFGTQNSIASSALPKETSTTSSNIGGFNFGTQSANASLALPKETTTTSSTIGGFNFGAQSSSSSSVLNKDTTTTLFGFGAQNPSPLSSVNSVTTATSTVGGFSFGGNTSTAPSAIAPGGFNFGNQSTAAPAAVSSGGVSFTNQTGSTTVSTSAPGGFNFGATTTAAPNSVDVFNTGAVKAPNAAITTPSTFNFGSKPSVTAAPSLNANTGATTTPVMGAFAFGSQPTTSASAVGSFNFGTQNQAPASTTTTAAGVFINFGAQNVSSTGGFNFGTSNSSAGVFSFGTTKSATIAAPGMFGSTSTPKQEAPKSVFAFGAGTQGSSASSSTSFVQQSTGSQPNSTNFNFGQSTTTASSVFGQPNATQSGSPFVQSQPFGQTSQPQSPAFVSNTSGTSFGQTGNTQSVFGQPTGSQKTTGFGQPSQTTSSFGQQQSGQPSFNFGQQSQVTQSGAVFGQPQNPQQSFAFGQQQNLGFGQQPAAGFGQPQNPPAFGQSASAPAFTKSASSPCFGSTNGNSGGQGFNFGMSTPMKNPQSPAGSSGFNFGTPQNNSATPNQSTPANANKGFDFSQSLTPSFNFGAGGNTSFGTPGGSGAPPQPNFGAAPSFNVGATNNQQVKNRPVRKPVRRTRR